MLETAKKNPLGYLEFRLRDIRTKNNTSAAMIDEYLDATQAAGS